MLLCDSFYLILNDVKHFIYYHFMLYYKMMVNEVIVNLILMLQKYFPFTNQRLKFILSYKKIDW